MDNDNQLHYHKYNARAERGGNCKECSHNLRVDWVYQCEVRGKSSSYNYTCDRWQLKAKAKKQ